jgi:hypothetical protein
LIAGKGNTRLDQMQMQGIAMQYRSFANWRGVQQNAAAFRSTLFFLHEHQQQSRLPRVFY